MHKKLKRRWLVKYSNKLQKTKFPLEKRQNFMSFIYFKYCDINIVFPFPYLQRRSNMMQKVTKQL